MSKHDVTIKVNGVHHCKNVPARMTLVDYLRDECGLTGTHVGCEHGICGACTVEFDGRPVRSCLMFAVQADGHQVKTVEGLAEKDGKLSVLQDAFCETHALQCLWTHSPVGSRMAIMMGGAAAGAAKKIIRDLMRIAAHNLGVAEDGLVYDSGTISVSGARTRSWNGWNW